MRLGLLLVLLPALLGLTSCGGDEPLTETEYRAAGNQLCDDWSAKISELTRNAPPVPSQEEIVEFSNEAGSIADDYTERLLKLSAPESLAADRATIEARIAEYEALIKEIPETQDEANTITDAGDAISAALGDMWSTCRAR